MIIIVVATMFKSKEIWQIITRWQFLTTHLIQGEFDHIQEFLLLFLLTTQSVQILWLATVRIRWQWVFPNSFQEMNLTYFWFSLDDCIPLLWMLPFEVIDPLATGDPPLTCSIIFICFSWQSLTNNSNSNCFVRSQSTVKLSTARVLDCSLPGISLIRDSSNWNTTGVVGDVLNWKRERWWYIR